MQTSVELQDPFSYALWPIIVMTVVLVAGIVTLIVLYYYKVWMKGSRKVPKPKAAPPVVIKKRDPLEIRLDYLSRIDTVQRKYEAGQIDARVAHQELSAIVRLFVNEMTGINIHTFSLSELKSTRFVTVSNLIEEFYAPEFALRAEKDTMNSIADARKVIQAWN